MKRKKMPNHIILSDDRNNFQKFATYLDRVIPKEFGESNVVVDLEKYGDLDLDMLLLLLETSNAHRGRKKSFVIVNKEIDIDDVPFEMIVVPTLQEAADIIEMEEIERDLGF